MLGGGYHPFKDAVIRINPAYQIYSVQTHKQNNRKFIMLTRFEAQLKFHIAHLHISVTHILIRIY